MLPGALTPAQLWQAVAEGRDLVSQVPAERWRTDRQRVLYGPDEPSRDRTWSDRGGYVSGFESVFDPSGFAIDDSEIVGLDPVFQWVLHTAREALRDAGRDCSGLGRVTADGERRAAVFGNLSFPSAGMSRFAESVWFGGDDVDPRNRFSSGLPALMLERALELDGGAFALDAACASSLYAFKTACDWLDEGRADLVLAGAVNCADDLFIHVGFSALSALSRSGRSRPFHRDADGLVPAEGAGFLVLRRLEDAERDGDTIHGVIRGIGLSNDGRGQGFLVPSAEGQRRALVAAYEGAAIDPASISLLECHATGTKVGDAVEINVLADLFADRSEPLPIGSLKSNCGHLITAAGVGATIKVLEAMKAGVKPPSLHADATLPELEGSGLRVLHQAEAWEAPAPVDGQTVAPRRAGISAFGFGGNNAHMIVEEYLPRAEAEAAASTLRSAAPFADEAIAIVSVAVVAAGCPDLDSFAARLFGDDANYSAVPTPNSPASSMSEKGSGDGRIEELSVHMQGLGTPPNDLRQTLAQQLLVLDAGRQAAATTTLPRERSSVFVGMGVDAEVARYGARWRFDELTSFASGVPSDDASRDRIVTALESAGVIGTMPNIPSNRLNRALDLGGPSCSVSAEEASGLEALELAVAALRRGELDAALVAAVDLACEPVQQAAAQACLGPDKQRAADAACAIVIKRLSQALADGDQVIAVLENGGWGDGHSGRHPATIVASNIGQPVVFGDQGIDGFGARWGHAHAASGLLHVVTAALALQRRCLPGGAPWLGRDEDRRAEVQVTSMQSRAGSRSCWQLTGYGSSIVTGESRQPCLFVYQGRDRDEVLRALRANRFQAPWELDDAAGTRLVLFADSDALLAERRARAEAFLLNQGVPGAGVHFREQPVGGDLGFVFASAGTSYRGMGRELSRDLPVLGDVLAERFAAFPSALSWAFGPQQRQPNDSERLCGASAISQVHCELTRNLLGLKPQAAIGYSSGESNSLFALGAWRDIDSMRAEIEESALYERELGGSFDAVARAWGLPEGSSIDWQVWNVSVAVEVLREAIAEFDRVHLAIIHTSRDCVLAGDGTQLASVRERLATGLWRRLDYNLAAHVPEVDQFREPWLAIHRRRVTAPKGIRFYSGGAPQAYVSETERCTQNIFGQAHATLNFPRMIERAWADGIRVFVEHGPGSACSSWIRDILGERAAGAVVVSLDRRGAGVTQVLDTVAALLAAGVAVDPRPLLDALRPLSAASDAADSGSPEVGSPAALGLLTLPAHPEPIVRPTFSQAQPQPRAHTETTMQEPTELTSTSTELSVSTNSTSGRVMVPAPTLPSVLDERSLPQWRVAAVPAPPVAPAVTFSVAADPQVAAWSQGFADLTTLHTQFLQQQAEVHGKFLALQQTWSSPSAGTEVAPALTVSTALPAQTPINAHGSAIAPLVAPVVRVNAAAVTRQADVRAVPADRAAASTDTDAKPQARGLTLSRQQLEVHGAGKISEIYGPLFE